MNKKHTLKPVSEIAYISSAQLRTKTNCANHFFVDGVSMIWCAREVVAMLYNNINIFSISTAKIHCTETRL